MGWVVQQSDDELLSPRKSRKCSKSTGVAAFEQLKQHRLPLATIGVLLTVSGYLYLSALTPIPDLDYLKDNLPRLGRAVTQSALLFCAAAAVAVMTPLPSRVRMLASGTLAMFLLSLVVFDQGASLERHGMYNAAMFVAISLFALMPFSLAIALFRWLPLRRFILLGIAMATLAAFVLFYSPRAAHSRSRRGFFGESLDELHGCNFDSGSMIPVQEMVQGSIQGPIMNFWAGPQTCHKQREFAQLSAKGELTIDCPAGERAGYIPLPKTKHMDQSIMTSEALPGFYRNLTMRDYTAPVKLAGVETVAAHCGKETNYLFRVHRDSHVAKRAAAAAKKGGGSAPNVMVLFIDALSRRHLFRRMPKTAAVLEQLGGSDDFELFQFFKYHAVGHSTGPNTHALFTGLPPPDDGSNSSSSAASSSSAQAASSGVDETSSRRRRQVVDRVNPSLSAAPVSSADAEHGEHAKRKATEGKTGAKVSSNSTTEPLWHLLNASSYVTGYVNGMCEEWSSQYNGRHQSADHELVLPFCAPEYHYPPSPYGLMTGPYSSRRRCMGGQLVGTHLLDYSRAFWRAYSDLPKFLFAGFLEGHEGTAEVVRTIDDGVADFIADLFAVRTGVRETILFVLSDHGQHMSPFFLFTDLGRLEHQLPLLTVLAPRTYVSAHEAAFANMRSNAQSLVTGYDVYQTWRDMFRWSKSGIRKQTEPERGTSLFRAISLGRTCSEADVPDEFCKCRADYL